MIYTQPSVSYTRAGAYEVFTRTIRQKLVPLFAWSLWGQEICDAYKENVLMSNLIKKGLR